MPESMIHLFKGDLFWHMPKDLVIDVGPTRHIFPPKPFKEDTEKYGNQTTLTKTGQPEYCLLLELWLNPIRWCARIWTCGEICEARELRAPPTASARGSEAGNRA